MDARQRDDNPPPNDVMTREELQFEREFAEWKEAIAPIFQAKLLACCGALMAGNGRAREFYEATIYEAFCWTKDVY